MTMESGDSNNKNNKGLGSFLDSKPVNRKTKSGSATVTGDRIVEKMTDEGEIYIRADGKKVRRVKKSISSASSVSAAPASASATKAPPPAKKESLGSFLDSGTPKGGKKMSGSATVTGSTPSKSLVSTKSDSGEEMEIYIRADGKKVRRVKRTKSGRGLDGGDDDGGGGTKKSTTSSAGGALSGFLGAEAAAKPKSMMSGSATVSGGAPSTDGEIIIRADGKKVRRVRKAISSAASAAPTPTTTTTTTTNTWYTGDRTKATPTGTASATIAAFKKPGLGSFLDSSTPKANGKKMSGSATVTGAPAARSSKSAPDQGEIYINKDGKKVRRVKKTISSSTAGDLAAASASLKTTAASAAASAAAKKPAPAAAKPGLGSFLDSSTPKANGKKMSGSATVTGSTPTKSSADEGEIYIRADGKKVRRVKRTTSSATTDDIGGSSSHKSATATTTTPTTSSSSTTPAAAKATPTKTPGLGNFLDIGASIKPKMSGSATVSGDHNIKQESEVYIRADGKKVRRVRKTVSKSDADATADAAATTAKPTKTVDDSGFKKPSSGLSGFLGANAATRPKMSGSATVTGAPSSTSSAAARALSSKSADFEGEIYINKDGKKVRRVRRTISSSSNTNIAPNSSAAGDLSSSATPSKPGLAGFLDKGTASASMANKASGSATVCGSTPTKQQVSASAASKSNSEEEESEVYIRADGKKVRRVKKTKSGTTAETAAAPAKTTDDLAGKKSNLGNFLGSDADVAKARMSGSATVAGDQVVQTTDEGEIVIRADGKKVLRRKKTATAGAGATTTAAMTANGGDKKKDTSNMEVYRRADGKLVRRVKKSSSSSAGDLAGFFDSSAKKNPPKASGSATVCGDMKGDDSDGKNRASSVADFLKKAKAAAAADKAAPDENVKPKEPSSQFAMGGKYRTMLEQGMAPEAVKAKMVTDGVNAKVISVVMDEATQKRSMSLVKSTVGSGELSKEQEGVATSYRKMLKMGLPDDVVRHKMVQDGIAAVIIKAVVGDEPPPAPEAPPEKEEEKPKQVVTPTATTASPTSVYKKEKTPEPLAPEKPKAEEDASGLSDDEEATALAYRKMLKMGLPASAVRHKMNQDGVDAKIIAAVMGEPAPEPAAAAPAPAPDVPKVETATAAPAGIQLSDEEEGVAAKYRRMFKMGLPPDAIRHKMVQDGVEAKIIAAVMGDDPPPEAAPAPIAAAPAKLSDDEESIAGKYRRMFKMGLPADAIRQKMIQDGVDAKIIAAVMCDDPPPGSSAPEASKPEIKLSDDEEAVASKYRRMFKMGLPPDAIRHKMVQDGIEAKIIAAVMGDDPPAGSTTTTAAPAPASASAPAAPSGYGRQISAEDNATVEKYRKMLRMGLPKDSVKHKMLQDEVATELIDLALTDEEPTAAAAAISPAPIAPAPTSPTQGTAMSSQPHGFKAANAVAYIVVVSDDPNATPLSSLPKTEATPEGPANDQGIDLTNRPPVTIDPSEKYAVKVNEENGKAEKTETNYMTLDELAAVSGQSRAELEKLVTQKRQRAESPPRFVLAPVEKKQPENLYEVVVPQSGGGGDGGSAGGVGFSAGGGGDGGGGGGGPTMAESGLDPRKKYQEIKEGQEVVDTKLASAAKAVSILGDLDIKSLLEKLQRGDMEDIMLKLQEAEKRQKKLEKQLAQAGVAIAEDIDYMECQVKVAEIAKRMGEIGGSDVVVADDKEKQNQLREEYFKLEQAMEKYNTALMLTEEYQAEQDRLEKKWEDDNEAENMEALRKIRRHMPVKIRHMSEAELCNTPSPNGKFLPKPIAKKFKRTNVLQCLRINPDDLERMHPSTLENMRVTGLTLTERRACYAHLKSLGPKWEKNKAEKMAERKWTWFKMMKNNFKENVAPYQRHIDQFGPPGNHTCNLIGKQCPIKADKIIDYDNDYGWTPEAEYEVSEVRKADTDDPGAKAMAEALELAREKKANERADLLKKHYKGKLLQVSKANGSCENMDESMDKMEFGLAKWVETKLEKGKDAPEADKKKELANFTDGLNELKLAVLDFAQRSGMQMSGKKKAGGDGEDIRSSVEAALSTEVCECAEVYFKFMKDRMKEIDMKDTRIEKTMELIQNMLKELNGKNIELFKKLGVQRPERSRKLKQIDELIKEAEERLKPKEEDTPPAEEAAGPPRGGPMGGRGGRGGLLDAIGARGRGGGGGRGGLLDAIAAGRGAKKAGGGGRGGFLDAIAARGNGAGGGGDGGGGGRGGLMAAIAARGAGKGRGGGDGGGGRGGLMAAIAARGGGG